MELDIPWIGKRGDANPVRAKVVRCYAQGKGHELELQLESNELRRMSLWGDNKNRCIAAWGSDETKWPGRMCSIFSEEKVGEKRMRVLTPL